MTTQLRNEIETSSSYRFVRTLSKYMDDYYIDPIVGFAMPAGTGDALTQLLALPYLYICLAKIRSVPLTLAVVCNMLLDMLMGLIPFFIGDAIDIFMKSHKKNQALIEGFIDGDQKTISEVNGKAYLMAGIIVVLIALIVLMIRLVAWLAGSIGSLFHNLGTLFA